MTDVSATIALMLHASYTLSDDTAREQMKSTIWELIEPFMRDALARGIKVEAYVEQLTSQEK